MHTLSLCMIVKNEEDTLARCLNSCKGLFDEIIIVDTGSNDNTKKIAKKYTSKIYDFAWVDDFSEARNFAFKKATGEYLMWLDADDVIPKTTLKYLIDLKQTLFADVYMLKYNTAFFDGKPTFSYYRERIIKNCANAIWNGVVHECITPFGKVIKLDFSINHRKKHQGDPDRNLKIYKKIKETRKLTPREQYYYGRELYDHKQYPQSIKVLESFVKDKNAWVENVIDALFLLSNCYLNLNNEEKQMECLTKTFIYDLPRANIVCKIGDFYLQKKRYEMATYWYKLATNCKDVTAKGGFVEAMYYNYYPYLQLCYCYYCLNNNLQASKYNQLAKKYYKSEQVLNNEKYFNNVLNN